jgi:hypothetical protein
VTQGMVELHPNATKPSESSVTIGVGAPITAGKRPPLFVTRDELFFWTAAWQKGEAESRAERDAGQIRRFDNGAELLDWLRSDED